MNAESNLALALSIVGMVVGLALLVWVSLRRAQDWHRFSLVRMFSLLAGCLLSPSPLYLVALRSYPDKPQLFVVAAVAAFFLSPTSLCFVAAIVGQIRGDGREY